MTATGRARVNHGGREYPDELPCRTPGWHVQGERAPLIALRTGPADEILGEPSTAVIETVYRWMLRTWGMIPPYDPKRAAEARDQPALPLEISGGVRGPAGDLAQSVERDPGESDPDPDGTFAWLQLRPASISDMHRRKDST